MTTQQKLQQKTYVKGSLLYSTDGIDYQQKQKEAQQKIVQDKSGTIQLKYAQMRRNLPTGRRRHGKTTQKQVLIPIRDTPVQPVPQPINDNQRCQRATQQQYQYFQTYISQKQKQKQFQELQDRQIRVFLNKQQRQKEKQIEVPQISLVMQKQQEKINIINKPKVNKKFVKIKVCKKTDQKDQKKNNKQQQKQKMNQLKQQFQSVKKIRVLNE